MALNDFLSEIANAIREKKGTTAPIKATNFASEIASIQTGGGGSSDLIDVTALPTTVDDSKIYRQKGVTYATCYIAIDQDGTLAVYEIGQALSLTSGESIFINYEVVDKLPATGNDFFENGYTVYVVKDTAIGYVYTNDKWYDLSAFSSAITDGDFVPENKGEIESIANITEVGIYTVFAQKTVIGIPNENNNRGATFWNGTEWGFGGKVEVINGGNLPEVGVEGTIYFRNNVPQLIMKGYGLPFITVLGLLEGIKVLEKAIILQAPPQSLETTTDGITFPIGYLKVPNGYIVYMNDSNQITSVEIPNSSTDYYIEFNNEIWYFRKGQYVRISPEKSFSENILEIAETGTYYTNDLYAVKFNLPVKNFIENGVSGALSANDFIYDEWESYKTVRTGALAGCVGVTSIERFDINNVFLNTPAIIGDAAFYGCTGLTTVDIQAEDGIGKHTFYGCTNLQSVYVYYPSIGEYAFANCTSLKDIHFDGTKAEWKAGTFGRGWNENTGNYTVHCTDGDIAKS